MQNPLTYRLEMDKRGPLDYKFGKSGLPFPNNAILAASAATYHAKKVKN